METDQALLGNQGGYTVFQFGGRTIRFRAPYSLERYTKVKHGTRVIWSWTRNTSIMPATRKNTST